MAGYVPNAFRALLLEAAAGRTTMTVPASKYLGLATVLPEDPLTTTLATLNEVTTAGYARIVLPAWAAASVVAPVQIANSAAFSFAALTADMTEPANYAFLCDVVSGTAGTIRYIWELAEPLLGRSGEPINIPASTLIIE